MPRLQHKQQKLVVLFDAENISHTLTRPILLRAACDGAFVAACNSFIYTESIAAAP